MYRDEVVEANREVQSHELLAAVLAKAERSSTAEVQVLLAVVVQVQRAPEAPGAVVHQYYIAALYREEHAGAAIAAPLGVLEMARRSGAGAHHEAAQQADGHVRALVLAAFAAALTVGEVKHSVELCGKVREVEGATEIQRSWSLATTRLRRGTRPGRP